MKLRRRHKKIIIDALTVVAALFSVYAIYFGLQFFLATEAPLVVVVGGSMRPALDNGDLVIIQGVPASSIRQGEIIAFELQEPRPGNSTRVWSFTFCTVHRVIGIRSSANGTILFTTKGDDNDIADVRPVPDHRVQGHVIYRVPYLGYLVIDPTVTFSITIIIAIIILIWPEKKKGFRRHKHFWNR